MTKKQPEVVTFGCRLNSAESEAMQRHAMEAGLNDAIIVNTCAVTAEAERQAGQAIRRVKRENPEARIIVTGCASQIDPAKFASMTEVAGVIDNNEKLTPDVFARFAQRVPAGPKPDCAALPRPEMSEMQRAFVQVQNGCNNACTFCIVPFGRGASRSVSFEKVIDDVRAYVKAGFNEVVITGVDIASYGRDLPGEPTLGFMAKRVLDEVPKLSRLRLSSVDPAAFDEDLWELIEQPRMMPHIHLSLQSGDDMILKRMKRRHTRDDVFRLVERARKVRPDIVLGADIIAGFPTETDAMFTNTFNLAQETGLTWLHVFPYSARKGTPAARMPQVHGSVRKERADRLRKLGEVMAQRHYDVLVGTTVKVLVEKSGIGCTPHFAKLKLRGTGPVGAIVDARVAKSDNGEFIAEI